MKSIPASNVGFSDCKKTGILKPFFVYRSRQNSAQQFYAIITPKTVNKMTAIAEGTASIGTTVLA